MFDSPPICFSLLDGLDPLLALPVHTQQNRSLRNLKGWRWRGDPTRIGKWDLLEGNDGEKQARKNKLYKHIKSIHKPQNLTEFMLCLHHQNEFYWQKKRRLHGVLAFEHIFIFYLVSTHYFWMCPHPKKLCCHPAYHFLNARTCICPLHWLIATLLAAA